MGFLCLGERMQLRSADFHRLILDSGTQAVQIEFVHQARFDSRCITIGICVMRKLLHSTTSITLCMALVVPGMTPTMAAAQTVACGAPGEQTTFPCALPDGTEVTNEAELQSVSAGEAATEAVNEAPQPEAAEETEAAPEAQTEQAAEADAPSPSAEQAVEPAEQEAEAAPADTEQQSAAETTTEAPTQEEESTADAEVDQQNAADAAAQAEQEAATQAAELEQALKDEQAAAESQAQEQPTEQT